jgi:CBS-domain-containing membrane protein
MRDIVIKFQVSDARAALLSTRDVVVTPLSDFEAGQFAVALAGVAEVLAVTREGLATLLAEMEARGEVAPDIRAMVARLSGPLPVAIEQQEYIRVLLGRSARIGRDGKEKETLQ